MKYLSHPLVRAGLLLFAWAASLAVFFRSVLFSSFARVIGDPADGQLIVSIHEHWFRVLRGLESWHNLNIFYPLENTLGYSDTFLATGLLFSGLRFLGLDPYLAHQLVLIILATVGFWGLYLWLRSFRGIRWNVALFCAFLFIVASPMVIASRNSHIQLLSIWLFPVGLILLEWTIRRMGQPDRRCLLPFLLFTFWLGLLTYSTFYVAFFFGLLVLLALIGALLFHGPLRSLEAAYSHRKRWPQFLPGLVILSAWALLFLMTYLPPREEIGGHSFAMILVHLPEPWNLINHSTSNLLWGKLAEVLPAYPEFRKREFEVGFTPLFFVLTMGLSLLTVIRFRREQLPLVLAAWVFLAGSLLVVRIGERSLWYLPYTLLPGSEGIRAAFRFNLALLLPALYLLATYLGRLAAKPDLPARALLGMFCLLLPLEQVQVVENANLGRKDFLRMAAEAPPPPEALDAFYAFGSPWLGWKTDVPHNTAGYLSQVWDLPTINGRTGLVPNNWDLHDMRPGIAFAKITPWARGKDIEGKVGLYNLDTASWSRVLDFGIGSFSSLAGVDLMSLPPDRFARIGPRGWSGPEPWGVWSDGPEAVLTFGEDNFPEGAYTLQLKARGFAGPGHPETEVEMLVNGRYAKTLLFTRDRPVLEIEWDLPEGARQLTDLTFRIPEPRSPKDLGIGEDSRELGIGLQELRISGPPTPLP